MGTPLGHRWISRILSAFIVPRLAALGVVDALPYDESKPTGTRVRGVDWSPALTGGVLEKRDAAYPITLCGFIGGSVRE
jgi:hypothetical protein